MATSIPFSDIANFSEEVFLDDSPYRFRLVWNVRKEYWTLGILTRDLVSIVAGIKLILGYDLLDQYPKNELPPGELYAVDMTGDQKKITRDNILNEVQIVYIPEDELDTI